MTVDDIDDAILTLRCASDDWIAGIRHVEGALIGTSRWLHVSTTSFLIACEVWDDVGGDSDNDWAETALEAAQLLEDADIEEI